MIINQLRSAALLFLLILPSLHTMGQPTDNAGAYMSYFNEIYKPIQKDMWDYTSSVAKGKNARKVEAARVELLNTLKFSAAKVRRAKEFRGDGALRDVTGEWMETSLIILKEEYEKIMNLEDIAEDSYDNMEAYMKAKEIANQHMKEKSKKLSDEVERFAKENNVTLIEEDSRISRKLEKADEVFKYYNQVYLVFFRSFKQEAYLLNAIQQSDLSGIEQNRVTLKKFAEEGITELRTIANINSDNSIEEACRELLEFYIKESGPDIDMMVDFQMKKENFSKIQAAFEAKSKSKRSQTDIDKFNKAVKDMNDAGNLYNQTNDRLNKERSAKHNNWNQSVDRFLGKYAT